MMAQNVSIRAALACVSGFALALAFPKADFNLAAWVAFVPLLYAIDGESRRGVFAYSWLQGFCCNVASLYWITITLHSFTDVRIAFAVLPMLLAAAVIALFTSLAIWAADFITARLRISIVVTLPVTWVAVEWLRTYFPIGFPWNLLGYTAYQNLTLIQFAEFTGVYGISGLIMLFNVVIYVVLFRRETRRVQGVSLATLSVIFAAAWIFGWLRMGQLAHLAPAGSLRFAMVQGNIPQTIKWDPNFLPSSFAVYVDQSQSAARLGADLIVWPEAAATFFFQPDDRYPPDFAGDAGYRRRLLQLAAATGDPILFGAPALGVENGRVGFYNRAYLVSGDGKIEAWYDKIQLVPFGEYVPLRSLLGYFVNRIVTGFGDMFPGRSQTIFKLRDSRIGVLICYESIFPDLARRAVKSGANILVNITNDAWYGDSSAPYQLLAMAAMRSVETRAPMVRVANTGISAVIEPSGEIAARTPLFKRGTEIERVSWHAERTFYTVFGNLFAEICFGLAAAVLLMAYLRREREPIDTAKRLDSMYRNGQAH